MPDHFKSGRLLVIRVYTAAALTEDNILRGVELRTYHSRRRRPLVANNGRFLFLQSVFVMDNSGFCNVWRRSYLLYFMFWFRALFLFVCG